MWRFPVLQVCLVSVMLQILPSFHPRWCSTCCWLLCCLLAGRQMLLLTAQGPQWPPCSRPPPPPRWTSWRRRGPAHSLSATWVDFTTRSSGTTPKALWSWKVGRSPDFSCFYFEITIAFRQNKKSWDFVKNRIKNFITVNISFLHFKQVKWINMLLWQRRQNVQKLRKAEMDEFGEVSLQRWGRTAATVYLSEVQLQTFSATNVCSLRVTETPMLQRGTKRTFCSWKHWSVRQRLQRQRDSPDLCAFGGISGWRETRFVKLKPLPPVLWTVLWQG